MEFLIVVGIAIAVIVALKLLKLGGKIVNTAVVIAIIAVIFFFALPRIEEFLKGL